MMNSQELETAVRLKMNLTVIILRDNGYGMIRWKQSNMGFADFGWTTATRTSCAMPRPTAPTATGSTVPRASCRCWSAAWARPGCM